MIRSHGYVAQRAARQKRIAAEQEARERVSEAREHGRAAGIREEQRRTVRVIGVGDGHILIGEKPKHREVIVPLMSTGFPHYFDPRREVALYERHPTAIFRPVRKAWASGEGHTVVWFDWEFVGC